MKHINVHRLQVSSFGLDHGLKPQYSEAAGGGTSPSVREGHSAVREDIGPSKVGADMPPSPLSLQNGLDARSP